MNDISPELQAELIHATADWARLYRYFSGLHPRNRKWSQAAQNWMASERALLAVWVKIEAAAGSGRGG